MVLWFVMVWFCFDFCWCFVVSLGMGGCVGFDLWFGALVFLCRGFGLFVCWWWVVVYCDSYVCLMSTGVAC